MSEIQCCARSNCDENIYRKIESSIRIVQNGWNDISSTLEGFSTIISKANQSIDIIEFLDSKLDISYTPSNAGWNYKACCPFHKSGNERTPSFFINKDSNRYFCQACNAHGGVVDFISKTYYRPQIAVAEHILQCVDGGEVIIDDESVSRIKRKKIADGLILKMSNIHRAFILENDDDDAVEYAMKIMKGFDLVYVYNSEKVEDNIEEILEHFKMYLKKY